MGRSSDEFALEFYKEKHMNLLRIMSQKEKEYKIELLTQQALLSAAAKKTPMLEGLLYDLDDLGDKGDSVARIGGQINKLVDAPVSGSIGQGVEGFSLSLGILKFLSTPVIYLLAWAFNVKLHKLNNTYQLIYSGVLLGLAITALAVPPLAPIIAFIGAGIGLGAACYALGKTLNERYQLGRERKRIEKDIQREQDEMDSIRERADLLGKQLENAIEVLAKSKKDDGLSKNEKEIESTKGKIKGIYLETGVLYESYNSHKKLLQQFKTESAHVDQKIKQMGTMHVLDKSLGVIFGTLSAIGLVVSLFFPPIGLGIIGVVALTSTAYLAARLVTTFGKFCWNWITNKKASQATEGASAGLENVNQESLQKGASLDLDASAHKKGITSEFSQQSDNMHDSTAEVFAALVGGRTGEAEVLTPYTWDDEEKEESLPLSKPVIIMPTRGKRRNDETETETETDTDTDTDTDTGPKSH